MCGIVGVIGRAQAAPLLLEALRRLEYRGYDSAGIATLVPAGIERRRAEGKLHNLATVLDRDDLPGTTGIGHTRWATHGAPTERNAHPHATARVAVVHNGIIENHAELRAELEAEGALFETETDTETFVRLLDRLLAGGAPPEAAFAAALKRVHGAFALAAVFAGHPKTLLGARQGAPLAVGYGEGEMFLGSDALALAPLTRRIAYLEEGDWVALDEAGARVFDAQGAPVERAVVQTAVSGATVGKGNYRHFMEKELHEHPAVLGDTLRQYLDPRTLEVRLPRLPFDPARVPRLTLTACGSAYLAAHVGRYWIEGLARIPCDADVASELRYRDPPLAGGGGGDPRQPVGRDGRHDGRTPPPEGGRADGAVDRQRAGEHDGARLRRRAADGGGAGGGCRLDQGLHGAARGAGVPGGRLRPRAAADDDARGGAADPGAALGARGTPRRSSNRMRGSANSPPRWRRRATCCSSAAGRCSRSPWRAR
jgi:glucosamine--fructose-6-phosphate aminotransferase (isomerizing)